MRANDFTPSDFTTVPPAPRLAPQFQHLKQGDLFAWNNEPPPLRRRDHLAIRTRTGYTYLLGPQAGTHYEVLPGQYATDAVQKFEFASWPTFLEVHA